MNHAPHAENPHAPKTMDKRSVFSWCLYDWGIAAFYRLVQTFVFSYFFIHAVMPNEKDGQTAWGYMTGASAIAIALLSPVFGAIADRTGRQKPWLLMLTVIGCAVTALLYAIRPDPADAMPALWMAGVALVCFELAFVFYNAMLPHLAPSEKLGWLSGISWSAGYAGGIVCLALALFGFQGLGDTPGFLGLSTDEAFNTRSINLLVAVWVLVFAIPLFLWTPDSKPTGIPFRAAVGQGLRQLGGTLRNVRKYKNIMTFLGATALYNDGLNTLFAFGGIYAGIHFGMELDEVLLLAIALNVTAGIGAAGFAFVEDKVGSKRVIVISLICLIVMSVPLLLTEDKTTFWILALAMGLFIGPPQAANRTMLARLSPPSMVTEMFGLYSLSGKATNFLGPVGLALLTSFYGERAGLWIVVVLYLAGLALLWFVREERSEIAP